jgi:hypothetical protein
MKYNFILIFKLPFISKKIILNLFTLESHRNKIPSLLFSSIRISLIHVHILGDRQCLHQQHVQRHACRAGLSLGTCLLRQIVNTNHHYCHIIIAPSLIRSLNQLPANFLRSLCGSNNLQYLPLSDKIMEPVT